MAAAFLVKYANRNPSPPQAPGVVAPDTRVQPPSTDAPKKNGGSAAAPKTSESKKAAPPPAAPATAVSNADAITLELTAKSQSTVVFDAEGQPGQILQMKPGESATLHAQKEATLVLSGPIAPEAKLNGKPISFGDSARGGQFHVTPEGVKNMIPDFGPGFPPTPGLPPFPAEDGPGNRNAIGSPQRQKELALNASSARLFISSPALPEVVTLIVRVDDVLLFRREATISPPTGLGEVRRRLQMPAGPTAPLAVERLIPPGMHDFQVSVQLGNTRLGQVEEVSGQFDPRSRHTLQIQFRETSRGERGNAGRFTIQLY